MITEIEIEGFKSLEKVHLKLGGLNLFIGANASGKSNFLEALRVLQGIGYGFTADEIFNGKPKSAGSEVWGGIRGGSALASFSQSNEPKRFVRFSVSIRRGDAFHDYRCELSVGSYFLYLRWECVSDRSGEIIKKRDGSPGWIRSILAEPWGQNDEIRSLFIRALSNSQRLEPSLALLRDYSQNQIVKRLGERGENFAALIRTILRDSDLRSSYLSWLRQLTPVELDDVDVLSGALGEPLFALKERGVTRPAPILSDGTLRFAALTAAFFQPDMPDIIILEEIENGIHPSRLRLLMELLKSQSGGSGPQVFATTHSPVVLAWLEEKDYETTFLCKRDEETGASIIKPLSEIPHLVDLVRKQPIGELFTEGWLEGAF